MDMRGLAHFIRDVRQVTGSKAEEERRVDEELAKICAKFKDAGRMTTYDRKKYVCKLMFITMLGYPVTFGHMEGLALMAEESLAEKLIGYLSITVLMGESHEVLTLATQTIYRDLLSPQDFIRGLALTAIANTGGADLVHVVHEEVQRLSIRTGSTAVAIRQKALMALLRVYRKEPSVVDLVTVVPAVAGALLSTPFGLCMCAVTFLDACISERNAMSFEFISLKVIEQLRRLLVEGDISVGYYYYGVAAPWLQVKLLRLLQRFPAPSDTSAREQVIHLLLIMVRATGKVLKDAQGQKKQRGAQNRVSAMAAIFYEAVSLAIHWALGTQLYLECAGVVGSFITNKHDANTRYMGFVLLSSFARMPSSELHLMAHCRQYQLHITVGLHDTDVSIRCKALEVIVAMCNESNFSELLDLLLSYVDLPTEPPFKRSLILSIAFLAERYCTDPGRYTDIMLDMICQMREMCPPAIVHRTVHAIAQAPTVQKRAAGLIFTALSERRHEYHVVTSVAALLLGQYGYQVALNPESSPRAQFSLLYDQLRFASVEAQAMVLHAMFHFYCMYDSVIVREGIVRTLRSFLGSMHMELQQRAKEYIGLIQHGNSKLLQTVSADLPPYPHGIPSVMDILTEREMAEYDGWAELLIRQRCGTSKANGKPKPSSTLSLRLAKDTLMDTMLPDEPMSTAADDAGLDALFHVSIPQNVDHLRRSYAHRRECFIQLLRQCSNSLYADEYLTLHYSPTYHHADGRAEIRIQGTTEETLRHVSLEIISVPAGLLVETRSKGDGTVTGSVSLVVEVATRSLAIFAYPPTVRLTYDTLDGRQHAEMLSLPITVAHFISPYATKAVGEVQLLYEEAKRTAAVVSRIYPATVVEDVDQVIPVLGRYGMSVVHLSDAGNAVAVVGAHSTQPNETVLYTPVACEVLVEDAGVRVTVYAATEALSMALLDVLKAVVFNLHTTSTTQAE